MTKFKVIKLVELLEVPNDWKWPNTWHEEFREKFEAALNRMAKAGWIYVNHLDWAQSHPQLIAVVFRQEAE